VLHCLIISDIGKPYIGCIFVPIRDFTIYLIRRCLISHNINNTNNWSDVIPHVFDKIVILNTVLQLVLSYKNSIIRVCKTNWPIIWLIPILILQKCGWWNWFLIIHWKSVHRYWIRSMMEKAEIYAHVLSYITILLLLYC